MPATKDQLLKLAASAKLEAGKYEERADEHERIAKRWRRFAARARAIERTLAEALESDSTTITGSRSMFRSKMELQNARASKRVKISSKMTSDSDAKRALLEANITPRDVAKLLDVGHSTVNAWCTGARSIPRVHVDRLREKHRIPAKVWPKIAG